MRSTPSRLLMKKILFSSSLRAGEVSCLLLADERSTSWTGAPNAAVGLQAAASTAPSTPASDDVDPSGVAVASLPETPESPGGVGVGVPSGSSPTHAAMAIVTIAEPITETAI